LALGVTDGVTPGARVWVAVGVLVAVDVLVAVLVLVAVAVMVPVLVGVGLSVEVGVVVPGTTMRTEPSLPTPGMFWPEVPPNWGAGAELKPTKASCVKGGVPVRKRMLISVPSGSGPSGAIGSKIVTSISPSSSPLLKTMPTVWPAGTVTTMLSGMPSMLASTGLNVSRFWL
jgi:hypothetical protein